MILFEISFCIFELMPDIVDQLVLEFLARMLLVYTFCLESEYSSYLWFRSFKRETLLVALSVCTSLMAVPFALVRIFIVDSCSSFMIIILQDC